MARRALAILEERAAGYSSLDIPAHLQIELEDKREEVARLEAQIAGSNPVGASAPAQSGGNVLGTGAAQVSGNVGGDGVTGSKYDIHIHGGQIGAIGDGTRVEGGIHFNQQAQSAPATASADTASLRRRLQRLDDVQIDALCMDHFPDVYDTFARGLRRDEKVNLLLDHCRRNPEAAAQLAAVLARGKR